MIHVEPMLLIQTDCSSKRYSLCVLNVYEAKTSRIIIFCKHTYAAVLQVLADNNINGQALAILSHHIFSNKNLKLYKLDLSGE